LEGQKRDVPPVGGRSGTREGAAHTGCLAAQRFRRRGQGRQQRLQRGRRRIAMPHTARTKNGGGSEARQFFPRPIAGQEGAAAVGQIARVASTAEEALPAGCAPSVGAAIRFERGNIAHAQYSSFSPRPWRERGWG